LGPGNRQKCDRTRHSVNDVPLDGLLSNMLSTVSTLLTVFGALTAIDRFSSWGLTTTLIVVTFLTMVRTSGGASLSGSRRELVRGDQFERPREVVRVLS
jgi:hypothetical protein